MITDVLIRLLEDRINEKYPTFLVPFDKAYPTSGISFIRLSPNGVVLSIDGNRMIWEITIKITCSIRIRTQPRQGEYKYHLDLIDTAEKVYLWVYTYFTFTRDVLEKYPLFSIDGRFESGYMELTPQPTYSDFYDSQEVHERKPAGMKIEQSILLPRVRMPMDCGQLHPAYADLIGLPRSANSFPAVT